MRTVSCGACLGAGTVEALDIPITMRRSISTTCTNLFRKRWWGRFNVVFDVGALEHVVNFPVAVANLMRMAELAARVHVNSG